MIKKIFLIILIIIIMIIINANTLICQADTTVDTIIGGADSFVSQGEPKSTEDKVGLHETSKLLYNLLLGIGIIAAVIVGVIIGIKFMIGSVEEKAEMKEVLTGYVISCIVVFGAFAIWKFAVNVLT